MRQFGKQAHLDRAQKYFRGPKAQTDLQDMIRYRMFAHDHLILIEPANYAANSNDVA